MVVPMRLAATMRLRLFGAGGAVAGDDLGTTSWGVTGTFACRHTVGIRRSGAHVARQHSSRVDYACGHHAGSCTLTITSDLRKTVESSAAEPNWSAPGPPCEVRVSVGFVLGT
jgi:hypothetical protein